MFYCFLMVLLSPSAWLSDTTQDYWLRSKEKWGVFWLNDVVPTCVIQTGETLMKPLQLQIRFAEVPVSKHQFIFHVYDWAAC